MIIKYSFTLLWLCCSLILCSGCKGTGPEEVTQRPNIILIQMDDLGYDDLSIHGNPYISTPTIDSLGNDGAIFMLTQYVLLPGHLF